MSKNFRRRNPLQKEKFLEGNRQKWGAILLGLGLVVLGVYAWKPELDNIDAFMTYFTVIGCVFMAGAAADSALKINAAGKYHTEKIRRRAAPDDETPAAKEDSTVDEDPFRG